MPTEATDKIIQIVDAEKQHIGPRGLVLRRRSQPGQSRRGPRGSNPLEKFPPRDIHDFCTFA